MSLPTQRPRAALDGVPASPVAAASVGLLAPVVAAGLLSVPGAAAQQVSEGGGDPLSVPVPPPTSAAEVAEFADSLARSVLRETPAAGMSVAVLRGPDTLVMEGWGRADLEERRPATAGTVYPVGSVTKQFTAAAVLELAQAGRLGLGDTLRAFVPRFAPGGPAVTIRQLLAHTSGIVSYTDLDAFWRDSRRDLDHGELLALVEDEPLRFRPGTGHAYSNTGYYLLGMILEEVTGRPYEDHLRERLLLRLGLESTRYCARSSSGDGRAEGYRVAEDGTVVEDGPLSMEVPFAAGGLCSTVGDLAAWTRALHGGRVVGEAWLEKMTTAVELPDGRRTGYGLGLAVSRAGGHRKIGHGGSIKGFASHVAHYPDDGLTVAVLANTRAVPAERVGERIARKALGLPQPDVVDLPLSETDARRYTGKYVIVDRGLPVQVRLEDGRLMAQPAGQPAFELLNQGRHRFRAGYDPAVTLTFRMDDGRAAGFVLRRDGDVHRADRVERTRLDDPD